MELKLISKSLHLRGKQTHVILLTFYNLEISEISFRLDVHVDTRILTDVFYVGLRLIMQSTHDYTTCTYPLKSSSKHKSTRACLTPPTSNNHNNTNSPPHVHSDIQIAHVCTIQEYASVKYDPFLGIHHPATEIQCFYNQRTVQRFLPAL